jgi:DNA-directed RNA polymerase specialized sigma24 family protein
LPHSASTASAKPRPTKTGSDFPAPCKESLGGIRGKYSFASIRRYVDAMDLQEICLGLGISAATVKRRLSNTVTSIQKLASKEERAQAQVGTQTPSHFFGRGQ